MSTKPKRFALPKSGTARAAAEVDPAALAEFTSGADAPPEGFKPWEGLDDTRRVNQFVLRLTDAEVAKLAYIGEKTRTSKHGFCVQLVREALERGTQ